MKKIVLTGANGQIGKVFSQALIKKKHFVYAIDLNIENIKPSHNFVPVDLDITNEIKVNEFFSSIQDVDILINNAGVGVFTPFEDRTASEFRKVFDKFAWNFFNVTSSIENYEK